MLLYKIIFYIFQIFKFVEHIKKKLKPFSPFFDLKSTNSHISSCSYII